jgi:hypothetical protein
VFWSMREGSVNVVKVIYNKKQQVNTHTCKCIHTRALHSLTAVSVCVCEWGVELYRSIPMLNLAPMSDCVCVCVLH